MLETVLLMLALIPAMLGLAELLHILKSHLLSSKKKAKKYLLVFLDEGFAQSQLSEAIEQQSWFGKRYSDKVFAVYTSLSETELESCRRMAAAFKAELCSIKDFNRIIY